MLNLLIFEQECILYYKLGKLGFFPVSEISCEMVKFAEEIPQIAEFNRSIISFPSLITDRGILN